jgi:hypothetical protein
LDVGSEERLFGGGRGRPAGWAPGPSPGLHFVRVGHPALDCGRGVGGEGADRGGVGIYVLGVCLHFFIAFSAAGVYYGASRRLFFLKEHPLVCGLFYGAGVELVMRLIVLPLSALHARGPYQLHDLIQGLFVHMVVVGLPIAFSVRRFAR